MKTSQKIIRTIATVAAAFAMSAPLTHAATAAGAGIEVDGTYIGGYTITQDAETREELVRGLGKHPITFERDYKIPVDKEDPAVATLQGDIRIVSKIAGNKKDEVEARALRLVKREGEWFVDAGPLARLLQPQSGFENVPDGLKKALGPDQGAIEFARAHIRSNLMGEYKKLAESYAPKVTLMPGHEYLKDRYGLAVAGARAKGAEVARDKLIVAMEKASEDRPALPKEHADRILGTLGYESVEVKEGDFVADAADPVGSTDGKLHFTIKKEDRLIKVSPQKVGDFILIHLRWGGDSWSVVSEYLD